MLQGSVLKIAFIFILVGFGTKVGLAPMHTWLPDAHSQAPAPISALLSGVLLNTAMYGIIRVMIIVNRNMGSSLFTGRLLMILGILSIGTAAVFIIVQKDFKRILAYSSIEHMGILAFGFGIMTPLSIFGSIYHILNHAFTKSLLFMASGNVFLKFGTRQVNKVHGIIKVMPVTGIAFLLGIFAITGMPLQYI
jgi:hydrogenase-4 component F